MSFGSNRSKRQRSGDTLEDDHSLEDELDEMYTQWQDKILFPLFRDLQLQLNNEKQCLSPDTNWPLASMALTQYIFNIESVAKVDWVSLGKHWDYNISSGSHPQVSDDTFSRAQINMHYLCSQAEIFANNFLSGFAKLTPAWLNTRGWGRALHIFLTAFPIRVAKRKESTPFTWKDYFQIGKNHNLRLFQLFEKIVLYPDILVTFGDSRSYRFLKAIFDDFYPLDPIAQLRHFLGWGVISCVIYPFIEDEVPPAILYNPHFRISEIITRFGDKRSLKLKQSGNLPRLIQCQPKCLEVNGKYFLLLEKKTYDSFRNAKRQPLLLRCLAAPSKDYHVDKLNFKAPIKSTSHPGYIEFELLAAPLPPRPNSIVQSSTSSAFLQRESNSMLQSDFSDIQPYQSDFHPELFAYPLDVQDSMLLACQPASSSGLLYNDSVYQSSTMMGYDPPRVELDSSHLESYLGAYPDPLDMEDPDSILTDQPFSSMFLNDDPSPLHFSPPESEDLPPIETSTTSHVENEDDDNVDNDNDNYNNNISPVMLDFVYENFLV